MNRRLNNPIVDELAGVPRQPAKQKYSGGHRAKGSRRASAYSTGVTNAEQFYYVKQMQKETPIVVTMNDGKQFRGVIEWYDRATVRVRLESGSEVLLFKRSISHFHKQEEEV